MGTGLSREAADGVGNIGSVATEVAAPGREEDQRCSKPGGQCCALLQVMKCVKASEDSTARALARDHRVLSARPPVLPSTNRMEIGNLGTVAPNLHPSLRPDSQFSCVFPATQHGPIYTFSLASSGSPTGAPLCVLK